MTGVMVLLGRITGAHGLKGEVKIAAFTAQPGDIASYGALTNADGSPFDPYQPTALASNGPLHPHLLDCLRHGP